MDNQYNSYKVGSAVYYRTNFPKETYKYLTLDNGYIYIYQRSRLAEYFTFEDRDNELRLQKNYSHYTISPEGIIAVYEKGRETPKAEISPIKRNDAYVRVDIYDVQEKLQTNSYGNSDYNQKRFDDELKTGAHGLFTEWQNNYAKYWKATYSAASASVKDYMNAQLEGTVSELKHFLRTYYLLSAQYTTAQVDIVTDAVAYVRRNYAEEYAYATIAEIQRTAIYQTVYDRM